MTPREQGGVGRVGGILGGSLYGAHYLEGLSLYGAHYLEGLSLYGAHNLEGLSLYIATSFFKFTIEVKIELIANRLHHDTRFNRDMADPSILLGI